MMGFSIYAPGRALFDKQLGFCALGRTAVLNGRKRGNSNIAFFSKIVIFCDLRHGRNIQPKLYFP
jgi:hypothetical protein